MFDLDVDGMLEHLLSIPDAILMVSNPCIELWYLLHFEKCHAELTQNVCIKKLKRHLEHYTKGTLALMRNSNCLKNIRSNGKSQDAGYI